MDYCVEQSTFISQIMFALCSFSGCWGGLTDKKINEFRRNSKIKKV